MAAIRRFDEWQAIERDALEYFAKEQEERADHLSPRDAPLLFLEVTISDPSEFAQTLRVTGERMGEYRVLCARSPSIPNAIAGLLLWIRDATGKTPHVYFNWTEGHPLMHVARFLIFGSGDIPPVTREILRRAEPDPERRPTVHVS